jgi:uncharacterized membrane protein
MTLLQQRSGEIEQRQQDRAGNGRHRGDGNAQVEVAVSVAAGSILAVLGLRRATLPGLLVAAVGGTLAFAGLRHQSEVLQLFGFRKKQRGPRQIDEAISERGIHVEQAYLINRSPEDLYRFWRNFENLPRIMTHLERIDVIDERRSHWVVDAPKIAGGKVEWDAEITSDEPNSRIAWRSLPGSQIDTIGEIRFGPGLGDRGTEVHVYMDYIPPAGKLGHWIATVFGSAPRRLIRDDLRNFKRLMEIGELPTISGQPRGTCTGHGTYSQ